MSKTIKVRKVSNKTRKNESSFVPKKNTKKKNSSKQSNNNKNFDEKIEEILEALKENYIQQKNLMNELRSLRSLHKKEVKLSSKPKKRTNSGKHTGFNKPEPIPPPLKELLKIKEDSLPRSKITGLMYQYFTDNEMYNTETKKEIIANAKIKKVFGMKKGDVINFYNLQTWLKKVYEENSENNNILKIED